MTLLFFVWCLTFGIDGLKHNNMLYCLIGPSSPTVYSTWLQNITQMRSKDLSSINYNASIFTDTPALDWTQSTFIQPQMHGYDAYFYDINTHQYTFDKWVKDLVDRYGGIDSFLFWVTYTNIGADDRNQFDMTASIPGQMKALQNMSKYFHSKYNINLLIPYNPWDTGTRPSGNPDYITMANFLNETGFDGFNGDTMAFVPEQFYTYSVNTYNHPIAIEPETGGNLTSLNWDTLGWGYWTPYSYQPYVGRWKWYDARHMTNICDRWAKNKTNDIQNAFLNGLGYESWENVWGSWNGIVPRDGEAIRRIATILRYFGNRYNNLNQQNFTQSLDWKPFIPIIAQKQYWNTVFASEFVVNKGNSKQQVLYLIVNRDDNDVNNIEITFNNSFIINSIHVFDCYHGKELKFTNNTNDNTISVTIDIEALGFSAILATFDNRSNNQDLDDFLNDMNKITQNPLNSYSSVWKYLLQEMRVINATKLYPSPPDSNMSIIPWGIFYFNDTGVEIEGDDADGVDIQFPFEMHPQREHTQFMTIPKFYMDTFPVTCFQYEKYLNTTKYKPYDSFNYLKNWNYNNDTETYSYPDGYRNKPVTYISLNEARLYCLSIGKRLPHSYEWQYAAQGNQSNYIYPWGNQQKIGVNFPMTQHGRTIPGPEDVDAFIPQGNSMFGVSDLVGNIWQYTDEFIDNHTRAVIVRGSSNYRPNGSKWYFPVAYQINQHNKYFLMDDSYERCGTIGFRCVADAEQPKNEKPMFWNGKGNYCANGSDVNGYLCGRIVTGKGYNNLTEIGELDWIQFGVNYNDNSVFKMIRKQTSMIYITNISASLKDIFCYDNNTQGFYWNDGEKDINVLSKDNSSTNGVYTNSNISFEINNLKKGNKYKLRIFIGVYKSKGTINVKLNTNSSNSSSLFQDSTVYSTKGIENVCYEINIDLSSVESNDGIKLLITWIIESVPDAKHITLQAIALELLTNN